ncbi:hypothetical protein [Blastochloris viridis]|uniref:Uncharacterized protein n=1 Tax=Blastochloris viridis TaxID=1079 RepID=A0A0P0IFP2_BLAVI|nr:hypothetical protein [Blastochloris viridis]ALK09868.1 hypothetical protein BVIR_2098 [Blastochloris viridis]CUU42531.1 hypothetical protein BVIRIDIS_15430 [Blastochloris viridis]
MRHFVQQREQLLERSVEAGRVGAGADHHLKARKGHDEEPGDGTPARWPASTSVFRIYSFRVCGVQPILVATDTTAAHREGCSRS